MLELLYTSTKQVTGYTNISTSYPDAAFIKAWDAMLVSFSSKVYKVFRDGTIIQIGNCASSIFPYLSLNGGKAACWDYFGTRKPMVAEPFTAQPILTNLLSDHVFSNSYLYFGDYIDSKENLLFHRQANYGRADVYNLTTGSFIRTITYVSGSGTYILGYAGDGRFCAIGLTTGKVIIYDYISDVVVLNTTIPTGIRTAVYDSTYNLILTISTNGYVNVYSLELNGTVLSSPAFSPVGNKYRMTGYVLSTRLTGAAGEVIPNKWIHWELLGTKGTLEKSESKTNILGYAYNFYWGPTEITDLGSETVRVWSII